MKSIVLLSLFLVVFLTGCATFIDGDQKEITINTDIRGKVKIYDINDTLVAKGKTPFKATLKSQVPILHAAEKNTAYTTYKVVFVGDDNQQEHIFYINSRINKAIYGNLAFLPFCLAGFGIDYISGAAYTFEDSYNFIVDEE